MNKKIYDFSGWATVHGVKCSDGRIIQKDAFKENDGKIVPLVWNHDHNEASNVLGHALLETKDKGVYAYCSFNDTDTGKHAKELVKHGDICALSIYANKLIQKGPDVTHGMIREVSLVLAGANPGAYIDNVMTHGAVSDEEAHIFNSEEEIEIMIQAESEEETPVENKPDENQNVEIEKKVETEPIPTDKTLEFTKEVQHSESEETIQMVFDTLSEKQKNVVYIMLGRLFEEEGSVPEQVAEVQHKDGESETLQDVFDTLSEKQKRIVFVMIAEALNQKSNKEDKKEVMKQNAFEKQEVQEVTLTHSDLVAVIGEAKKGSSLRDTLNDACLSHGITNMDFLFPDAKAVPGFPKVVDENNDWVSVVMAGIKHTPFSRIKSTYFDITGEDARALGYAKGDKKVEEVIVAAKRTTDPQTIYKLQKFDRDDVVDVTDFDVVSWIKAEMRGKLEAELARAILFGDGRSAVHQNKIDPLHIRPVLGDSEVYSIHVGVSGVTAAEIGEALIDQMVVAQLDYKGSGSITAFIRNDIVTRMLLLKDLNKHRLYKSVAELATAMNVTRIVKVPASVMGSCYAVALDLSDYNVGADKGGAVSLFDDFDINYNKMEYLIETRCSGANVTPYSALVFVPALPGASSSSSIA